MQLAANNDKLLATPAVKLAPNGIPCITLDLPVQLRGEEHCPGLHPGEVSPKDRILIKQDATFILQDTYRYLQIPTVTYYVFLHLLNTYKYQSVEDLNIGEKLLMFIKFCWQTLNILFMRDYLNLICAF